MHNACTRKLTLLLAGGLLFGTSVASAANSAMTECGFDGEQAGDQQDDGENDDEGA